MTVASVLRSGGDYDASYVQRLARAVERNAPGAHFVCLADVEVEGVECIPLGHDWPRWWPKIELFRPGLFRGPVLYLDLDTVLVGSLERFYGYDGHRAVLADLLNPQRYIGSGVMLWSGDAMADVWEAFMSAPLETIRDHRVRMDHFLGGRADRPGPLWSADRIQDLFPGAVCSFKRDIMRKGEETAPEGASVVCFHGHPRPSELPDNHPMRKAWEA